MLPLQIALFLVAPLTAFAAPAQQQTQITPSQVASVITALHLQPFCRQLFAELKPTSTVQSTVYKTSTLYTTVSPTLATNTFYTPSTTTQDVTQTTISTIYSTATSLVTSTIYTTSTEVDTSTQTVTVNGSPVVQTTATSVTSSATVTSTQTITVSSPGTTQTINTAGPYQRRLKRQSMPAPLLQYGYDLVVQGCAIALNQPAPNRIATNTVTSQVSSTQTVTKAQTASITSPSSVTQQNTHIQTNTREIDTTTTQTSYTTLTTAITTVTTVTSPSTVFQTTITTATVPVYTTSTSVVSSTTTVANGATATVRGTCPQQTFTSTKQQFSLAAGMTQAFPQNFGGTITLKMAQTYQTTTYLIQQSSAGNPQCTTNIAASTNGQTFPLDTTFAGSPGAISFDGQVTCAATGNAAAAGTIQVEVVITASDC